MFKAALPQARIVYFVAIVTLLRFSSTAKASSFLGPAFRVVRKNKKLLSTTTARMSTKLESPSAERNKDPIWNVLLDKIFTKKEDDTTATVVLEIAAGAGVHTEYFSKQLLKNGTPFHWYPTDPDAAALDSIKARIAENQSSLQDSSIKAPLKLTLDENGIQEDANRLPTTVDVILNINMIHISPWSATLGLMKVAGMYLKSGGLLYMYGPYRVNGTCVESNRRFSESLQARDSSYGVRDLEEVVEVAEANGLTLEQTIAMPANNLSVLFRKR